MKPISLDTKQRHVISVLQARPQPKQTPPMMTPKRLSLLISLALHLVAALIATVYIVQSTVVDDDAIVAHLLQQKDATKPKRRISPRMVKPIEAARPPQIQPPPLHQPITTAVKIPAGDAVFSLPASDLSIPIRSFLSSENQAIDTEGLERKLLAGGPRLAVSLPKIEPFRSVNSSIIDKIELAQMPPEKFEPEAVELPTANLNDATQPPRFLQKISPKYPDVARRAQKEGVVWLEALVGVDGTARNIKILKGIGFGCDEAAVESLKASRFAPAKQGEQFVAVRIQIPYRFQLED